MKQIAYVTMVMLIECYKCFLLKFLIIIIILHIKLAFN